MRKSIIGFDVKGLNASSAWEAGFGSLYWMEGVVTRQRDRHGGGCALALARACKRMHTYHTAPRHHLPSAPTVCTTIYIQPSLLLGDGKLPSIPHASSHHPVPDSLPCPPGLPPWPAPARPPACAPAPAGDGKILSIMRVNNDLLCDLAALIEYDDSSLQQQQQAQAQQQAQQQQAQQQQASPSATGNPGGANASEPAAAGAAAAAPGGGGELKGRFLRYAFVPGLGVGHPAIQYDEVGGWVGGWLRGGGVVGAQLAPGLMSCQPFTLPMPAHRGCAACRLHDPHAHAYCTAFVPPAGV